MGNKCQLCLEDKELVKSHLIPRAMYDCCRTADSEPVLLTTQVMMQTSRQLQDRLLCKRCEDVLNEGGEQWLLPKLARIDQTFPLLDIIEKLPPDQVDGEWKGYAASRNPEIEVAKLIHFAMGVFWKASVHSWTGKSRDPRIELGPYREKVRIFLRSETPFPQHMGLVLGILPREKALISFNQPYRASAEGYHNFVFYVAGVQFVLSVGKNLPSNTGDVCFASNSAHPILAADFSDDVKGLFRRIAINAHKSQNLVRYLAEKNRNGPAFK
jgi:hypothetical protein